MNHDGQLPAPLVPPHIDLRSFEFMKIDVRRLLTSETWMLGTGDERAAAMSLWLESWHQVPAASLPDNDRMLAHLSQCPTWRKSRMHALRGWVKCSDGRLYHPVIAEKAIEAWQHKAAQKARTESARQARLRLPQNQSLAPDADATVSVTENVTAPVTENVTDIVTGSRGDKRKRQEMSQTPPPPPIPSESSSSSSEEPASKPENPPTATPTTANPEKPNGHIDWTPDGFVGLSEAQRLRWQDMFSDLSIPDQIARAGAWLHANREERDAIENLGEGFHAFLIRWLLREDRGRPTHQGR